MLIAIFITTLLNKVIVCHEDSNESRYIDLLPEEEKEQFLERIARRILDDANVKDDNNNKHSVEITENQLNEHNDFVKKILKEESENLRKNNVNGETMNENFENGESPIIKFVDKTTHDLEHKNAKDLNVRKKRRNSFDSITNDNDTYISVDVKYDNENIDHHSLTLLSDKNDKTHESETEKSIDNEPNNSDVEDIQVKNIRKHFNEENHVDEKIEAIKIDKDLDVTNTINLSAQTADHITEETTTSNQYQNTTDENDFQPTTENVSIETKTVNIETDTFPDKAVTFKYTTINNEFQVDNYTTIDDTANDTLTVASTESSPHLETAQTLSNVTEVNGSVILRAGIDDKVISMHRDDQKSEENVSKHNDYATNHIQLTTEPIFIDNLKSPIDNTSRITMKNVVNQSEVDVQNLERLVVGTEKINTVTSRTNIIKLESKFNKENHGLLKTNDITEDILKALRFNLLQDDRSKDKHLIDSSKQINNVQNSEYLSNNKVKEYNVYEIPQDKPIFTLQSKFKNPQNEEQPYYIPIHNYAPNNAYFNAQNRYGPNFDDSRLEKDNSDITDNDRSSKNENLRKFNFVKRADHKTRNIKKAKHFHPSVKIKNATLPTVKRIVLGDYADYYFAKRNLPRLRAQFKDKPKRQLPASAEETHPFSNLNRVKSHIRAIRHILFEQKRFGYVNKVNSTDLQSAEIKDYAEIDTTTHFPLFKLKREGTKLDNSEGKGKQIDYYIGRLKLDSSSNEHIDKLAKNIGYIKSLDDIKYIYLLPKTIKNNWYNIKALNKAAYTKEAKIDNHVNKDLRIKIYPSTLKPSNQSELLYDPFNSIIDMTDEKDLLQILEKLNSLNMTKTRSYDVSNELGPYIEVMKDMVHRNSRALMQYNWLGTTVDIQAAIKKLQDLIKSLRNYEKIHPSDFQLLKYVTYLYAKSKILVQAERHMKSSNYELRNKLFPKIRKKKKNYLKDKGLINRVWLLRREGLYDSTTGELFILNDFLYDLQNALFDFHEAITQIASVTKVKNQRWFENIKELYLNGDRRQLLKIVLHLSATRLFGMIEENSVNIEANLDVFIKENEEVVRETVKEFKFILILLKNISSN